MDFQNSKFCWKLLFSRIWRKGILSCHTNINKVVRPWSTVTFATQFFYVEYYPNIKKYLGSTGFHYYIQYMQNPPVWLLVGYFCSFILKPQKPPQTKQTCPLHLVSLTQNHTLATKSQTIFNEKSLLVTGLDSAHLAQGYSAAGDNEMVSWYQQWA